MAMHYIGYRGLKDLVLGSISSDSSMPASRHISRSATSALWALEAVSGPIVGVNLHQYACLLLNDLHV